MADEPAAPAQNQTEPSEQSAENETLQTSAESPTTEVVSHTQLKHAGIDRLARSLSLLAVLAVCVVAGTGYWLWQQLGRYDQSDAISTLQTELTQYTQQLQQLSRQQQQRLTGLEEDNATLQAGIKRLSELLARNQNDWSLAEVEYMLALANQRVQLFADTAGAIQALQLADRLLEKFADPAWFALRKGIADELVSLRAVTQIDTAGVSASLLSLSGRVGDLPILDVERRPAAAPAAPEQQAVTQAISDWQQKITRMLQDIWVEVKGLVRIRQTDEEVKPLLAPLSQQFLVQNVQLQFQTARLALLQQDNTNYIAALNTASSWIDSHFVTDAAAVKAMQNEIAELSKLNVTPALPDISASLRQLRQQRAQQATP